jgi:small subunit ribosomal protein S20
MPIIKSAKKRVRVARKATVRNARTKRSLKSAVKAFQDSLDSGKSKAADAHRKAQSELSKAGKKHVMHKNKIARKQRQLAHAAKAAGVNLASSAKKATATTAKGSPKKPATKKAAAKKPTTKKAPAKNSVAKKAPVK